TSRYVRSEARSQFAKSPMNLRSALRSCSLVVPGLQPPTLRSRSLARSLNSSGHWGSHGSGQSRPRRMARLDARGPPRPPKLKGGRMAMPDRFLADSVARDFGDGKIHLGQAPAI